jgi:hypothetical protein
MPADPKRWGLSVIGNLRMKPIGVGLCVFVVLLIGAQMCIQVLREGTAAADLTTYLVITVVGSCPGLIAGFVTASVSKRRGVLHSVVVGAITSLFQEIAWCLLFPLPFLSFKILIIMWLMFLVGGIVLSGLGGWVGRSRKWQDSRNQVTLDNP